MLDALVAEARLRWGLDPANGLQVVAGESLVGVPLEPSRPLLIVPLATLRASAGPASALAGRNGPGGDDPLAVLRRLYPGDHPVGRFGADDGLTIATLDDAALAGPLYLAPIAPELAAAGPWAMPWISARLRQPDGCPWDREQTHTSLRKHLLEEAYEVYDALEGGATPALAGELGDLWLQIVLHAQLAAEAGDLRPGRRPGRHRHQDRPAPSARVRRRGRAHRVGRQPAVGADQGRRAGRGRRARQARDSSRRRARSTASARRCRRSPPARRCRSGPPTSATTGRPSRASSTRSPRRPRSCAGPPTDAERAEEFGDLLFVLVNVARRHGHRGRGRRPCREREVPPPVRERRARRRRPGGRPARPRLRCARCAVGCRQG